MITIIKDITLSLKELEEVCKRAQKQSCIGCEFNIEHKGCYFRQGRTPNEWEKDLGE